MAIWGCHHDGPGWRGNAPCVSSFHKVLGVVFVLAPVAAAYLTYAVFTKKFADYDEGQAADLDRGLQLPDRYRRQGPRRDRGGGSSTSGGRRGRRAVTLGLYPGKIGTIPANVTGSIVPKTLFGEKYVLARRPGRPGPATSRQGRPSRGRRCPRRSRRCSPTSTRCCARSSRPTSHDAERHRDRPRGRGDQIGQNLETVDSHPHQPADPQPRRRPRDDRPGLRHLRAGDARVADILDNTGVDDRHPGRTVRPACTPPSRDDVAAFSDTPRPTSSTRNNDNLIRLSHVGAGPVQVFAVRP